MRFLVGNHNLKEKEPLVLENQAPKLFDSYFWWKLSPAALINIFILTMDQITVCNVKGVLSVSNPSGNCSSTEHVSVFQLIVVVLRPATLLIHSHRT